VRISTDERQVVPLSDRWLAHRDIVPTEGHTFHGAVRELLAECPRRKTAPLSGLAQQLLALPSLCVRDRLADSSYS